jgi:uncharacterized protein YndB with AHSA1/START domain
MLARSQDRMTMILPSDKEIVLTRVFDAPRRLVFEAWTRPEHVRRWYGCGQIALVACEIDLRVGGAWRYTLCTPDGAQLTIAGVYREIMPPGRLVYTEQLDGQGFTSKEALVSVLFAEHDGMTVLTCTMLHASRADRDARLATGVEKGAGETYDRLAEHLATMA